MRSTPTEGKALESGARDTRLDRTVAIKVLPPALASDPQFRERFDREARAISSLSHPHICTLHDIGEIAGTAYLVMEHLDGETLAARIARGALPLNDALAIGIQLADALDAAHRRGIVHRDVKPANIMIVRRAGTSAPPTIKLLDFGLARSASAVTSAAGESIGATVTQGLTATGTIIGTLQYMAPEQVEGLDADARTDMFALGVVLYEMVTGRKAFDGRTPASLIGAILKDDPPALQVAQPLAPAMLERVVRRCLAKDPDERWQSARDLKTALQWLAEAEAGPRVARPPAQPAVRWVERPAWIALVTALAVALAVVVQRSNDPVRVPVHATIEVGDSQLLLTAGDRLIAISPDGHRIAYSATRAGVAQIYLREINRFDSSPVRGTEGGTGPFFSPDGQWLGFVADRTLRKVPVSGGTPHVLCQADTRGAAWMSDGTIVFTPGVESGLMRVSDSGGTPKTFTELGTAERSHRWPSVLPDGTTVIFTIQAGGDFDDATIALKSLDTGEQKIVARGGTNPLYLPSGHIAFGREGVIMVVPFDLQRLEAGPTALSVLEGVVSTAGSGAVQFAVSEQGSLVYQSGGSASGSLSEVVWVNRRGESVSALPAQQRYIEAALSPAEKHVAVTLAPAGSVPHVWVYELATGAATRLTFSAGASIGVAWTPDGQYVTYRSVTADGPVLVRKPFDGDGAEEVLVKDPDVQRTLAGAWHPSGNWVTYGGGDIFVAPLTGERRPAAWLS